MNFINMCRLCAKSKNVYINVFHEEGQKLDLLHKVIQCLQIQMYRDDGLPSVVCNDCCTKLLDSSLFLKQALNAQVTLQSVCQEDSLSSLIQKECENPKVSISEEDNVSAICSAKRDSITSNICSQNIVKSTSGKRTLLATLYSWHCTDCPAVLENPQELQNHHLSIHQQPVKFLCLQCSKMYTIYKKFARHVRLHRNCGKFRCEVCHKGFATKQALDAHEVVHSRARTFTCKECGRSFRQASTLYHHRHLHASDVFPCSPCNAKFTSRRALQQHLKAHIEGQYFMCEICGKTFQRKQTLLRHTTIHLEERIIICSICGKTFKMQLQLQSHMRVHSEEKKHLCEVCGKQFRFLSTLTGHSRIHTGEKPYICEFCGQHFRFSGVYMIHRRKHTGERPYVCAFCGRTFTNFANHAKHMKQQLCCRTGKNVSQSHMDISVTSQMQVPISSSTNKEVLSVNDWLPHTSSNKSVASTLPASHFTAITFSSLVPLVNQNNVIELC